MTSQRVLVIDDDPYVLRVIALCLASINNIDIYGAATGYQGLKLADHEAPDLILLDFSLPGMDGLEALKRLRANVRTAHIPVIAITGAPRTDARCLKMISECEAYLPKPFDFRIFCQVVIQYLTLQPLDTPPPFSDIRPGAGVMRHDTQLHK
jgi:CheY-like chemotaxis protein